jgi:ABC-type siderophore export system fused ATPase/permease subunit
MNMEKVVFGFFIVLAMTLNFGFFLGDIDNASHHHVYELYAAIIVSLIATVLKFGDRTQVGAILLSTSLAADLQLITAAILWAALNESMETSSLMVYIVSLSGGALMANFVSVVLLISETISQRR